MTKIFVAVLALLCLPANARFGYFRHRHGNGNAGNSSQLGGGVFGPNHPNGTGLGLHNNATGNGNSTDCDPIGQGPFRSFIANTNGGANTQSGGGAGNGAGNRTRLHNRTHIANATHAGNGTGNRTRLHNRTHVDDAANNGQGPSWGASTKSFGNTGVQGNGAANGNGNGNQTRLQDQDQDRLHQDAGGNSSNAVIKGVGNKKSHGEHHSDETKPLGDGPYPLDP